VIVGGGIAGLATSLFAKKRNMHIPIYEKSSQLDCEDNLLWLAPNGLRLLKELGLLEQVEKKSVSQSSMLFSSRNLDPLMDLNCHQLMKSSGYPILVIKRKDLYQIILDELKAVGGDVFFDHAISSVDQTKDMVTLSFKGISHQVVCEYLIAADGIGSTVRKFIFPKSGIKYQGLCTYLGRSQTDIAGKYIGKTIEAWGFGTRFVFTSLDEKTVYWSAVERPAIYRRNSDPVPENLSQILVKDFQEYHTDVLTIIKNLETNSIHRCNFGVVTGLSGFYHNRVCLIGDAAHGMPPNMGQGASLALEDAYCLIQLLSKETDPALIGQKFTNMRRARVNQMMRLANTMNTVFQPKTRFGRWIRDQVVQMIPDSLNQKKMADLYKVPFLN
jgi:2-polyprenyl-6-methoxyphenol hydroxylase-like FAD-dependent oxidoreductase